MDINQRNSYFIFGENILKNIKILQVEIIKRQG
jgi:hypothetical protein